MADQLTPEREAQVKRITANIEACYVTLRSLAQNMSGLLALGRATCEEVKAYNLYALSIYDTQRGMLTSLRAAGSTDAPALPSFPTLFAWKGVKGEDAWKLDCKASGMSGLGLYEAPLPLGGSVLSGVLADAVASTKESEPRYLSSSQIKIITQDENLFIPSSSIPSLAELSAQGASAGLGILPYLIIAGIAIVAVAAAVVALAAMFKERVIQEETTERSRIQLAAYDTYSARRLQCLQQCVAQQGNSQAGCATMCDKLITPPNIKTETGREQPKGGLGVFGTIGLVAAAGVAGVVLWKVYQNRHGGGGDGSPLLMARTHVSAADLDDDDDEDDED